MSKSIRKMTKSQKRNIENSFKIFDPVRCIKNNEKRFMALPHSILNHPSFTSLSKSSKLVYIYMTDYATDSFQKRFTYPRRIYKNIVSNETFKKVIEELVEHGFIEVVEYGILHENIYEFSVKWKDYKTNIKPKRKTKITENKLNYNKTNNV